ncbi:AI-2E family transporter [Nitrospira sp.]|nr:AI-2E family transporter [Nitrospira sp.]
MTIDKGFCNVRTALDTRLPIVSRQQIFALVFFGILLFLLYQLALMFRPFLLAMVWATILAHLMFPLHTRLTAKLGGRVSLAAGLLTFGIMLLGVLPLVWTGIVIVREAAASEVAIREWVASGGLERLPQELEQLPLIGRLMGRVVARLGQDVEGNLGDALISSANTMSQFLVGSLTGFVRNVFAFVANTLIMIVTLFFFFRDGRELVAGLYDLVPLDASHKAKIFSRLDQTMRAVVKGVVVTAIVQGVLAGLAYLALGAPMPVGLTALTTILAPLPFGGTALVWVPLGMWLLWAGPTWKGVALLLWGGGVVSTVDQFLRPMLIGQEAKIPVFLLIFSVLGGLSVYGVIGVFLGPIVVALLLTALQIYREEYQGAPPAAATPAA